MNIYHIAWKRKPEPRTAPMTVLKILAFVLLFICLPIVPAVSFAVGQKAVYSAQILQYVEQDKVYLLENLRSRVISNSEKTVIDALLTEDGPQAARLFRKQLQDYPDPVLDSLSTARLGAYQQALSSKNKSNTTLSQHTFILQFGSFSSMKNAQELAGRLTTRSIPVSIYQYKGQYKVRSKKVFSTRSQATAWSKKLPFDSYIVHLR